MRNFLNLQLNIDLKFLSYILKIRNLRLTFMNIKKIGKITLKYLGRYLCLRKTLLIRYNKAPFKIQKNQILQDKKIRKDYMRCDQIESLKMFSLE